MAVEKSLKLSNHVRVKMNGQRIPNVQRGITEDRKQICPFFLSNLLAHSKKT